MIVSLAASVCVAARQAAPAEKPAAKPAPSYAIVISKATLAQPKWQAVVDALKARHAGAAVVSYDRDVNAAQWELSARMPRYVCFVARPAEAGRMFVVSVSRLMRELDDDPYGDAMWGILTGYDPADALRIAQCDKPLMIERGGSGAGSGGVNLLDNAFASFEGDKNKFWLKTDGKAEDIEVKPDPVMRLVECLNSMKPQVFFTSGHATEHDWQVGYRKYAGQFRCDKGQLYGITTTKKRLNINSPTTKVYLPMGNCLIGHIPGRDCMTLAWMHTGGVNQMFGYTAVTFFGYMGWGTKDYFCTGRHSLAESFFLVNQALVRDLRSKFPNKADIRFSTYSDKAISYLARKYGLNKDSLGLLWDRDVVAFYGDPAWQAFMPPQKAPWTQQFTTAPDGQVTFTITGTADGDWPKRGVFAFTPTRLTDIEITAGADLKPVVTDNFILVSPPGKPSKRCKFVVSYKGKPIADRTRAGKAEMARTRKLLADFPDGDAMFQALAKACSNRPSLLKALADAPKKVRPELSFLLTNMTDADLRTVPGSLLTEHATLAHETRTRAPWGKTIPDALYFNDVLPYAQLDETRDPWRKMLMDRFAAEAFKCETAGDAAVLLNRTIFKALDVTYNATKRPRPNQSPQESIDAHYASCTGQSVLLADACRACGIPARIAGIPSWKDHKGDANGNHGGNHSWVEIWSDGQWHYLGAAGSKQLDHAWFSKKLGSDAVDGSTWLHSIFASSFRKTGGPFPMVWSLDDMTVPGINVTKWYKTKAADAAAADAASTDSGQAASTDSKKPASKPATQSTK